MYDTTANTLDPSVAGGILAFLAGIWVFVMVLVVIMLVAMWKLFVKAGKPGWAAIVPIYNIYILLEIVGRPAWWLVLVFAGMIPVVGGLLALAFSIVLALDTARAYGKDTTFGILLAFVPFVGYPMLAFGNNPYVGPKPVELPIPNSTREGVAKPEVKKPDSTEN